jgi:polyisoprenoid-binding protein YceI
MKLVQNSGILASAMFLVVACGGPSDTVETTDALEVTQSEGSTLTIDPQTSQVNWKGYKPAGRHYGIIPVTDGELVVNGDQITGGSFTFDITSLKIEDLEKGSEDYGKLWGHLQSDDFFDAQNHPEAVFEVTSLEPYQGGDNIEDKEEFETEYTPASDTELAPSNPTHWISGNLSMRGTTKNIKFPAAVSVNNGEVSAKAGFNIDRTEWGLAYGDESSAVDKAKDQFIYNTVSVEFDLKAD